MELQFNRSGEPWIVVDQFSEAQWQRISHLLAGKAGYLGRSGADNRLFVNGVLWVLRSGAHWHDLPERYGKWKTVHKRFTAGPRPACGRRSLPP